MLLSIAAALGFAQAAAAEDFKIGAVASLSGPAAGFGKDYSDGFKAYVDGWNKRGGLKGRKIVLELLDDETSPVGAVNAFRRLASDAKTSVIWLGVSSNSALGIKPLSSEFKVPVVTGGAVDTLGIPANPYFFKVVPGTKDFMIAVVDWAKQQKYTRIATLNATDAYGQSEAKYLKELAAAAGIQVVAAETFAVTDTNFNVQLIKIRNSNAQMLYDGATGGTGILIFKQFKQLDLKMPLMVSQALFNRAFFDSVPDKASINGVLTPTNLGILAASLGGDVARMHKELSDVLGRPAGLFHTFGWDHGIATEWAINNSDGTRDGIRAALDKIKDLPAINGPLTYTPDNHIGQDSRGLLIARYQDGKFVNAAQK